MHQCRGCYECGNDPLGSIKYGEFIDYTEAMESMLVDNWVYGLPLSVCYCITCKLPRTYVIQLKAPEYLANCITKSICGDGIARQPKECVKLYTGKEVK